MRNVYSMYVISLITKVFCLGLFKDCEVAVDVIFSLIFLYALCMIILTFDLKR